MNYLAKILLILFVFLMNNNILYASENKSLKEILFKNFNLIIKSSSKTIDPVITELLTNKPQNLESFFKIWKDKNLYFIKKSKQFVTVKKKNQTLAVHILKNLIEEGYTASLTFLGDGKLKKDVEKLSTSLGINKYTKFLGNVENVQEHLINSNIYLHTATYEPFGLVLLEAII